MRNTTSYRARRGFVALLLGSLALAPAVIAQEPATSHQPRRSTWGYDVDVFGTVALGRFVQEFEYLGDEPLDWTYRFPGIKGLQPTAIELDGEVVAQPEAGSTTPRRRGRPTARRSSRTKHESLTATARLEPGDSVRVGVLFRLAVPVVDGQLQLALPAIDTAALSSSPVDASLPVGLTLRVRHDEPLSHADSSTHDVLSYFDGRFTEVELAHDFGLEGQPFELEFSIGSATEPSLLGYVGPADEDGSREILAVLAPPAEPTAESIRPKTLQFVLDTSGSMKDGKLEQAAAAVLASAEALGAEDRFDIVEFDSKSSRLFNAPTLADAEALAQAGAWLSEQRPGGGTVLMTALRAAIDGLEAAEEHPMIVTFTDGNVNDRKPIEKLLEEHVDRARWFFVGIGTDVNRDALLRFAEIGRGSAVFAPTSDDLDTSTAALFESVSEPLAWDLAFDWEGVTLEDVAPAKLPDLYAGRPVTVYATINGEPPARLVLSAKTMEGEQSFTVELPVIDVEELPSGQ